MCWSKRRSARKCHSYRMSANSHGRGRLSANKRGVERYIVREIALRKKGSFYVKEHSFHKTRPFVWKAVRMWRVERIAVIVLKYERNVMCECDRCRCRQSDVKQRQGCRGRQAGVELLQEAGRKHGFNVIDVTGESFDDSLANAGIAGTNTTTWWRSAATA